MTPERGAVTLVAPLRTWRWSASQRHRTGRFDGYVAWLTITAERARALIRMVGHVESLWQAEDGALFDKPVVHNAVEPFPVSDFAIAAERDLPPEAVSDPVLCGLREALDGDYLRPIELPGALELPPYLSDRPTPSFMKQRLYIDDGAALFQVRDDRDGVWCLTRALSAAHDLERIAAKAALYGASGAAQAERFAALVAENAGWALSVLREAALYRRMVGPEGPSVLDGVGRRALAGLLEHGTDSVREQALRALAQLELGDERPRAGPSPRRA